ncbi:putative nucleoporin, NSP1-like, nucleoporin NSP1/NUP62 [Helianthus annuus]|uniref:Nucleoporin, NSP1-like, nucleoporin NSP1/NUP62 n=1 Tax=Helianthus annuus TaxID=4232 RepID=A0A251V1Q7_HELAN|nr:putative nucleoporin, NSP1-like, nucleoporin NSP1/NUP62 [Helianthus annuus]
MDETQLIWFIAPLLPQLQPQLLQPLLLKHRLLLLYLPVVGRTTTSVSTTAVSAPKIPSEITGKTVEEIIKEWNVELQEQTSKFRKLANAIAEWDKRILNNRDVLLKLEAEVAKVVETQSNLERQLELIETHQQEADKSLRSVEEEAERIYKDEHGLLLDDEAASTRDTMYEQAEFIEREMEQMTEQIKSVIQKLNANQGGELETTDGMSPVDVVVRILNNQLSSLVWIDEKVSVLLVLCTFFN